MIVQPPKVIFGQLQCERDELQDAVYDVIVGVLGEGLDLGNEGEERRGMMLAVERVRFEVVMLVSAPSQQVPSPRCCPGFPLPSSRSLVACTLRTIPLPASLRIPASHWQELR